MGYYFPKAKTTTDLNPKQSERYQALQLEGVELPLVLRSRLEIIHKRIGPVTSSEIMSAFQELWQDAVVCWILSNEDPNIVWIDLEHRKDERTEEERSFDEERWKEVLREWREEDRRRESQSEQWRREAYPIRTFFCDLFAWVRKIF